MPGAGRTSRQYAAVEFLRRSGEAEAAETFLRAELASPRFRDEVLAGTRGWRIGGLFDVLGDDLGNDLVHHMAQSGMRWPKK